MKTIIGTFLFGKRTQGQPVSSPKFKTVQPDNKLTQDEWVKLTKFGNRYGHRGSFYNKH